MAHKAGHIEDWYKDEGMGGSWEDSPDGKGIGDTWFLPDEKEDSSSFSDLDFPEESNEWKNWVAADNWYTDPLFYKGLGNFAKTVGKDYWNTVMGSMGGISDFIPGVNILKPGKFFYNRMFRDEDRMKSDPTFDEISDEEMEFFKNDPLMGSLLESMTEDGEFSEEDAILGMKMMAFQDAPLGAKFGIGIKDIAPQFLKAAGNEIFQPSLVSDLNPYAEGFGKARMWANILPQVANIYATRGTGSPIAGMTTLMGKLPSKMRSRIQQTLPVTTGAPNMWRKWGRNVALSTPTNPMFPFSMKIGGNEAEAAEILTNPDYDPVFGDRDPVIFDDYVSERIQDIREPRVIRSQDERRGPGPWNEFKG